MLITFIFQRNAESPRCFPLIKAGISNILEFRIYSFTVMLYPILGAISNKQYWFFLKFEIIKRI